MTPQMDFLAATAKACMIYVTVGDMGEARKIAMALVTEKLVACVNILGSATSIYTWKGQVEEAQEFVLVCKTERLRAADVAARVKALHSYEVPCITAYDMTAGYPPFLEWISEQTTV